MNTFSIRCLSREARVAAAHGDSAPAWKIGTDLRDSTCLFVCADHPRGPAGLRLPGAASLMADSRSQAHEPGCLSGVRRHRQICGGNRHVSRPALISVGGQEIVERERLAVTDTTTREYLKGSI